MAAAEKEGVKVEEAKVVEMEAEEEVVGRVVVKVEEEMVVAQVDKEVVREVVAMEGAMEE